MARVDVVGVGYVGMTAAILAARAGHRVRGIEISADRLTKLQHGVLPFTEPNMQEEMVDCVRSGSLSFVDAESVLQDGEILIVATPTPRGQSFGAAASVEWALQRYWSFGRYNLTIIKSTTTPGTINAIMARLDRGHATRRVAHWPEFLSQGTAMIEAASPNRIVVGADSDDALRPAQDFIASLGLHTALTVQCTIREAECIKHFSNAALAVNQVLGAELAQMCSQQHVNADRVLQGVSADHRLDYSLLRPRVPLVDSCLRKDLDTLLTSSPAGTQQSILASTRTVAVAARSRASSSFIRHIDSSPTGSEALILGAGFTAGVSDTHDSLVWDLVKAGDGRAMTVWDPYVCSVDAHGVPHLEGSEDLLGLLLKAKVIAILVPHPELRHVDWNDVLDRLQRRNAIVLDFCDFFAQYQKDIQLPEIVHVYPAGGCDLCAE